MEGGGGARGCEVNPYTQAARALNGMLFLSTKSYSINISANICVLMCVCVCLCMCNFMCVMEAATNCCFCTKFLRQYDMI